MAAKCGDNVRVCVCVREATPESEQRVRDGGGQGVSGGTRERGGGGQ